MEGSAHFTIDSVRDSKWIQSLAVTQYDMIYELVIQDFSHVEYLIDYLIFISNPYINLQSN